MKKRGNTQRAEFSEAIFKHYVIYYKAPGSWT